MFTNTTGTLVSGRVLDEVWAREPEDFSEIACPNGGRPEGAFVAQLIEWVSPWPPDVHRSVRITHWLRPEGGGPDTWYVGGVYPGSMSLDRYRALVDKLREWLRTMARSGSAS